MDNLLIEVNQPHRVTHQRQAAVLLVIVDVFVAIIPTTVQVEDKPVDGEEKQTVQKGIYHNECAVHCYIRAVHGVRV